jgi:hypothetical protein
MVNLRASFPLDKKGNGGYSVVEVKNRPRRTRPAWATSEQAILLRLAMTPRIKQNVQITKRYYVDGWDCNDIAEEVGISPGAVRARLDHIRKI